ncbi:unnamed protein product, partial [Strongylus vulgaris]
MFLKRFYTMWERLKKEKTKKKCFPIWTSTMICN